MSNTDAVLFAKCVRVVPARLRTLNVPEFYLSMLLFGVPPGKGSPGAAEFSILAVGRDATGCFEPGQTVEVPYAGSANVGGTVMLVMTAHGSRNFGFTETSEAAFRHSLTLPAPAAPDRERLSFYLNFLDHEDRFISDDAHLEFSSSGDAQLMAIRDRLPVDKLRRLVRDSSGERQLLYAELLGVCGTRDDAKLLEDIVLHNREGYGQPFVAYLTLAGPQGLEKLRQVKLESPGVLMVERLGFLHSVSHMLRFRPEPIPREDLLATVRLALDDPDIPDVALSILTRVKDWSVIERVTDWSLKESRQSSTVSNRRTAVRYLYGCLDDPNAKPEIQATARRHLDEFRKRDFKSVQDVERFRSMFSPARP